MSLVLRVVALLGTLVLATAVLSWALAGRSVVAPLAKALYESQAEQAIAIADQVERGADPKVLGQKLSVDIRTIDRFRVESKRRRSRCSKENRSGREIVHCLGPRAPIAVKARDGWVVIRRDLDLEDPGRRFARLLLVGGIAVLLIGLYFASVVTRPLRATRDAMQKISEGDLEHRLPESGPKELREVAGAYNGMAARVREMLEAERRLLAGISHELRTPISRLMLEVEMLRDAAVDPKRLDGMEKDLGEIERLISELLESSRLAVGDKKLKVSSCELRSIVDDAVSRVQPTHAVQVSGGGGVKLVDHERLVRVVANLVQNADKYSPEGGAIEIALEPCALTVMDRGPGVPSESLARVFEPFHRVNRPDGKKGTGLGLMISKQIVELHGGRISASNREGGGLSVRVELPA
ncbi:MAG: HAMP domain-containing protein [Deltaproteobacteria bacterium]|nr:HAMP domain-containing protein [Deltaproteobacteria bacterium]